MSRIQIKVRIGNRHYPMRVLAHEEGLLRRAATELNEAMAMCQKSFSGADTQDLLAIVAFDQLVDQARRKAHNSSQQSKLLGHFGAMQKALDAALRHPEHDTDITSVRDEDA